MNRIDELIQQFTSTSKNPRAQLDRYLKEGKKAIGCMPYYPVEEIVYAAGMVPFGVWGGMGEISKAKEFFPTFYCSLAQRCLEMGLDGTIDGLSGMIVSTLCDTLRPFSQNYKVGVSDKIPMIFMSHPQHRKEEFGIAYTKNLYEGVKKQIEEIGGVTITDDDLEAAIKVYNISRAERRRFVKLIGNYPKTIKASDRAMILKAAHFMLKDEHTKMLKELNDALEQIPKERSSGPKVVTSGIIADSPGLLKVLDENKICIVADDIAHESRPIRVDVAEGTGDPLRALSQQFADHDQDPILYDPTIWSRPEHVVNMVKENGGNGILLLMMNFCDPEEMEYPSLKQKADEAGIPLLRMGYDQQMEDFAQVKTQLQAFADMLSMM